MGHGLSLCVRTVPSTMGVWSWLGSLGITIIPTILNMGNGSSRALSGISMSSKALCWMLLYSLGRKIIGNLWLMKLLLSWKLWTPAIMVACSSRIYTLTIWPHSFITSTTAPWNCQAHFNASAVWALDVQQCQSIPYKRTHDLKWFLFNGKRYFSLIGKQFICSIL